MVQWLRSVSEQVFHCEWPILIYTTNYGVVIVWGTKHTDHDKDDIHDLFRLESCGCVKDPNPTHSKTRPSMMAHKTLARFVNKIMVLFLAPCPSSGSLPPTSIEAVTAGA